jgi:hypothetical protein
MSIISSLPAGEIEFEQNDIKINIRSVVKKANFNLKALPAINSQNSPLRKTYLSLMFRLKNSGNDKLRRYFPYLMTKHDIYEWSISGE